MSVGRISHEAHELYAAAQEFDDLRDGIIVPDTPGDLPDLVTGSKQLAELSGLFKDLSDEVLFRAVAEDPGMDLGPVVYAYTSASVPAGRATEHFTEAYAQLGFLHQFAEARDTPDLRDAREAAFGVVQERLEIVRQELGEASSTLRGSADRLDSSPPYVAAALSRSARSANAVYRLPPKALATGPMQLAYNPSSRHAR
ncbi:hypothetical protein [Streptomyces sp. H27-D2]|uniref:hypothetical protein n=1 Tax=Streptomyces sp. H27-D2 TaxID=3046304 RepID=UPI002DB5AA65|nr:hypothetical protein [Streptomyces sp. H27-D2]MEC4018279.1 hypothetical protein [Streptomyces sp. H27-D2]